MFEIIFKMNKQEGCFWTAQQVAEQFPFQHENDDEDNKQIKVGREQIPHVSRTYDDGDNLMALVGSHGFLEIAQRNGNAAHYLQIGLGSKIEVVSNNT